MTIHMTKERFASLPASEIGHACFEPMVPVYQCSTRGLAGEELAARRAEFFGTLTPGQRALFFFSYYDHAIRSEAEFFAISQRYGAARIFGIVKRGAEYFSDKDMLALLAAIEDAFAKQNQSDVPELYRRLKEISPQTLAIIGAYVKANPEEFVCLEA